MTTIAPPTGTQKNTVRSTHKPILTRLTPYLLISPALILIFMFTIIPSINTLIASTFEFIPAGRARMLDIPEEQFVGLQNYIDLLDRSHFLGTWFLPILGNTLMFALATVLITIPIGLLMALLLNRRIRGMALWRFSMFYPTLLPLIGAANIWAFLYSDTVGLINTVLKTFSIDGPDWIGNPDTVLMSIIIVNIWKQAGFNMIFYLAGLQSIPRNIYEAAELDGAGYFQQLFYLTLPLLRRTTLFILITASTFSFQTVEQLAALNQGNPANRGNLLLWYIFQNLPSRDAFGFVNAMTVILVGILLIFTISNFVVFERQDDDA